MSISSQKKAFSQQKKQCVCAYVMMWGQRILEIPKELVSVCTRIFLFPEFLHVENEQKIP